MATKRSTDDLEAELSTTARSLCCLIEERNALIQAQSDIADQLAALQGTDVELHDRVRELAAKLYEKSGVHVRTLTRAPIVLVITATKKAAGVAISIEEHKAVDVRNEEDD